jgi:hypothetical protein
MKTEFPAKRSRGGQPGNHNSKKNRGNKTERRHRFPRGNRFGKGAPAGNQRARTRSKSPHAVLLEDYNGNAEAALWIEAHASQIDSAAFTADNDRDRALFDGYLGLTPEAFADSGQEYAHRLYTPAQESDESDVNMAA